MQDITVIVYVASLLSISKWYDILVYGT